MLGDACSEKSKHHHEGGGVTTFAIFVFSEAKNNCGIVCMRVHVLTTGGMYYYWTAERRKARYCCHAIVTIKIVLELTIARLDCPRVLMIEGFAGHTVWSGGGN